jgi:hypothetical protein
MERGLGGDMMGNSNAANFERMIQVAEAFCKLSGNDKKKEKQYDPSEVVTVLS